MSQKSDGRTWLLLSLPGIDAGSTFNAALEFYRFAATAFRSVQITEASA
ncbi:hypothetical protein HB780_04605 (plasmid) [Rhizobium lusitanum]|nr:hypothetical protein [Rhizobium lusitanum]QND45051.1 hypothetical protein HB780_04605 [Rhizobium lusitanum]